MPFISAARIGVDTATNKQSHDGAFVGPFSVGDDLYVLAMTANTGASLLVKKSTNGGSSWSTAASHTPTNGPVTMVSGVLDGTNIHIIIRGSGYASGMDTVADFRYYVFSTSTDSFTISNELIASPVETARRSSGIAVRGDGDVIVTYTGIFTTMGNTLTNTRYAIRSGGSWTTDLALTENNANHTMSAVVRGAVALDSHLTHIHYDTGGGGAHIVRTLSSSDTLSSEVTITTQSNRSPKQAVFWDDGGTGRVLFYYETRVRRLVQSGATLATDLSELQPTGHFEHGAVAWDEDAGAVYYPFVENGRTGSDNNLHFITGVNGTSWGDQTLIEEVSSVSGFIPRGALHASVYTRDGAKRLGVIVIVAANVQGDVRLYFSEYTFASGGLDIVKLELEDLETDETDLRFIEAPAEILKLENESSEQQETDLSLRGLVRTEFEDLEGTEVDTHLRSLVRFQGETLEISEQTISLRSLLRAENETSEISEQIIRLRNLVRTKNETSEITEEILKLRNLVRTENESAEILEQALSQVGLIRIESEGIELSEFDIVIVSSSLLQIVNEAVDVDEVTLRLRGLIRMVSEVEDLTETDQRVIGLVRTQNETIEVSEQVLRTLGLVRLEDEALNLTEEELHLLGLVRLVQEGADLAEQDLWLTGLLFDPPNAQLVIDGDIARITWDASPTDGVVDYRVFRRTPQTGDPFDPVVDIPVASGIVTTEYDDENLDGNDYDWQVFGRITGGS